MVNALFSIEASENYLHNPLGQNKLSALVVMAIECDVTQSLDLKELIETFWKNKER